MFFEWSPTNTISYGKTLHNNDFMWRSRVKFKKYWDGIIHLDLVCSVKPAPYTIPDPEHRYTFALLKSTLQKLVRRRKAESAVRVAWQMMSQDMDQTLRRIPIIMMEDACLHPKLPQLVWLMMAHSKGWELNRSQVECILDIVHDIASTPYRDSIPMSDDEYPFKNTLCENYNPLLMALMCRVCYGGTKGDMGFMKRFITLWHHRMYNCDETWDIDQLYDSSTHSWSLIIDHPPKLHDVDCIDAGIDFHCFPGLLNNIDCDRYTTYDFKKAIWYFMSSPSHKTMLCTRVDPYQCVYTKIDEPREVEGRKLYKDIWECIKDQWKVIINNKKAWEPLTNTHSRKRKRSDNSTLFQFIKKQKCT
jgi:hypothetical protein